MLVQADLRAFSTHWKFPYMFCKFCFTSQRAQRSEDLLRFEECLGMNVNVKCSYIYQQLSESPVYLQQ